MASPRIPFNLGGSRSGNDHDTLTRFIDERVRPTSWEMERLGQAVDRLVRYLHCFNDAFPAMDYRVSRVLKSGSLGRGTAVQNKMDIDLVVFMQRFTTMDGFLRELPLILNHLEAHVRANPDLKLLRRNKYMVKCLLRLNGTEHSVDILPAVDLIPYVGGLRALHSEMRGQKGIFWDGPLDHYSVCLAEKQKEFVKNHADFNPKIKDLIRLVKYWSKENDLATVSYCLELVCISVYQDYQGNYRFSMEELFKQVMEKLSEIQELKIAFRDFYKPAEYQQYWTKPYVMDPANPFSNTLPADLWDRKQVANRARETLQGSNHFLRNLLLIGGSLLLLAMGLNR